MSKSVTFAGVNLHPDGSIRYRGEWQNTSSCRASVESVGEIRQRWTLHRVGAGAVVAGPLGAVVGALLRKKVDDRELYLSIDGDSADWLIEVDPRRAAEARRFASTVNNAAREWAARERR